MAIIVLQEPDARRLQALRRGGISNYPLSFVSVNVFNMAVEQKLHSESAAPRDELNKRGTRLFIATTIFTSFIVCALLRCLNALLETRPTNAMNME